MSPRAADRTVRLALVETAARLLAEQEPLTLRRLAREVGTSTMAVYTHFGSMEELLREVRAEGFARLAAHLEGVPLTRDPIADLAALGWAYCLNAVTNPDLYRVMFMETTVDTAEAATAAATFLPVVGAVERAVASGRLDLDPPWDAAVEMWAFAHGMVTLTLGGLLTADELLHHLQNGIRASLIGFGDEPAAVDRSLRRALRRMRPADGLPPVRRRGATLAEAVTEAAPRQPDMVRHPR